MDDCDIEVNMMRHAVITAGSKGLGRKVTERLLKDGRSVTVSYRSDAAKVEELKKEWAPFSEQLQFVQGDILQKEDIERIIHTAMDRFGRIDYMINNAGPYIFERKKLVDYEDEEWYEMINGK